MTVDVVIVTWRASARIRACLERLAAQSCPHRVVVVDNASGDGTVELVRVCRPDARVVALERNVGFGAAVNRGVAEGKSEAIVLLNDDAEMESGCLDALLAPLARNPRCGMVAGLTMVPDADLVDSFGIELDCTLAAYNRGRLTPIGAPVHGRLAMPSAGLAAYRRAAFEQAGGFDERLFAYGEDVDLGLRMRALGWEAEATEGARAVHLGGASFGVDSPLQRALAGFARGFLLRRYGVLRSRAALRALLFEALVVGWGTVRHRTLVPLVARARGWRAAGDQRLPVPAGVIERGITAQEAFRRLHAVR